jgi:hypothetical protein
MSDSIKRGEYFYLMSKNSVLYAHMSSLAEILFLFQLDDNFLVLFRFVRPIVAFASENPKTNKSRWKFQSFLMLLGFVLMSYLYGFRHLMSLFLIFRIFWGPKSSNFRRIFLFFSQILTEKWNKSRNFLIFLCFF